MKRSSQAIRSWRAGPLVWRPGTRGRRLQARSGLAERGGAGAIVRYPLALVAAVLASRRGRLIAASVLLACVVLGGGWLWFRDSPLVSVQQVTITGESGPDSGAIRSALVGSARSMSTLDVQTGRLYSAVSAFPDVRALQVTTQFPHGMRIHVIEQLPVAEVVVGGGRRIAVAGDGTLLHSEASASPLPRIDLAVLPGSPRITDPRTLESLAAARTAPRALRSRIQLISVLAGHGVVARLSSGPAIYLGDASQLSAKWAAAVAVLADPGSAGASYIDVTDPGRPAAGALTGSGSSGSTSAAAGGTTTPGG